MSRTRILLVALLIQAAISFSVPSSALGGTETPPPVALSGHLSSQEEGPLEGVLITVRRAGANFTVTVVSNQQGNYSFPRARLEPGQYTVRIRAAGYDLDGAGTVEITAQKAASLDLKLIKAKDLAAQLTNSEWLNTIPGTQEQKRGLMGCVGCHTLERVFRSHYNAAALAQVAPRMNRYFEGTTPDFPQVLPPGMPGRPGTGLSPEEMNFVANANLSSTPQWQYPLQTLPRPKGKSTHVIITEYDMPRKFVMPHDTAVDANGNAWYCDDAHQFIGRLNLKTADIKEFAIPVSRPDYPKGCRDIYFDQAGSIWFSTQGQGGVAKFDPETEKFQVWPLSKELDPDGNSLVTHIVPRYVNVDHMVWAESTGKIGKNIARLNVETGEWGPPIYVFKNIPKDSPAANRPNSTYGSFSDSNNNCYFADISSEFIGRIDAKTLAETFYETPTFNSGPRRGNMDKQNRLWFAEFMGNRVGMFDTKTTKFQEWEVPTPFSGPYDAAVDQDGFAWAGGEFSDRVVRVNTKTNEVVEYMLPRGTDIRRVDVDNITRPPSLVVGSTHGYTIVRVEPLDTLN